MKQNENKFAGILLMAVCALMMVNCDSSSSGASSPEDEAPNWQVVPTAYTVETAPNWQVQVNPEPSSMSICVALPPDVTFSAMDTVAVFHGNTCVGKAAPTYGMYSKFALVYVFKPIVGDESYTSSLQLRWYNAASKRIYFTSPNIETFEADATIGSVENPKEYEWNAYGAFPYISQLGVNLEWNRNWSTQDEAALFVGDECRGIAHQNLDEMDFHMIAIPVAMRDSLEKMTLRIYDSELHRITTYEKQITMEAGYINFVSIKK